eukprot:TRINITY_DN7410_c0_g1_i1.p1 TRINITY_DN7410_c0_g1~~TRINITY_DN7410_c0_g1_i1.p1  ORF type:complete len:363 (-),score=52.91 TRINITY_DN7410_c0_g1_i1:59-1147(-)
MSETKPGCDGAEKPESPQEKADEAADKPESLEPANNAVATFNAASLALVVPFVQEKAIPFLVQAGPLLNRIFPYIETAWIVSKNLFNLIPKDLLPALLGTGMIFFGGHYLTTIAAIEAFRMVGWRTLRDSFRVIHLNYRKARLALRRDKLAVFDKLGTGDPKADQATATRKLRIILKSVDPDRLSRALSSLYAGCLAAVATVRFRYAQTITLGASMGEVFERIAGPFLRPILFALVPEEYHQWVPVVLSYGSKWIGVCIAWALQRVVSAFHSSIRGASLVCDGIRGYAVRTGRLPQNALLPWWVTGASMVLAALGFYWQIRTRFELPFPLSLICLPFALMEWFLTVVVNFAPQSLVPVPTTV